MHLFLLLLATASHCRHLKPFIPCSTAHCNNTPEPSASGPLAQQQDYSTSFNRAQSCRSMMGPMTNKIFPCNAAVYRRVKGLPNRTPCIGNDRFLERYPTCFFVQLFVILTVVSQSINFYRLYGTRAVHLFPISQISHILKKDSAGSNGNFIIPNTYPKVRRV